MPYDAKTDPSEDVIRLRSYFIWEREGCPVGNALDHWLRAKAELEAELEAEVRAASVAGDSTSFVMPRPPILTPPTRTVSDRIGSKKEFSYG